MNKLTKQILKFGVVGGIAFLIDFSVLYILTEFFHIYYLVSAVFSFIIALAFNYMLSIAWVFDVGRKQTIREVFIFVILSVIGLGINQVVMYVSVELISIYYMLAKIISTVIVMVYNFITRKIFIEAKEPKI